MTREIVAERRTEDRRLVVLRLLAQTPGYEAGETVMHLALQDFGHSVSHDQVRTDFAWLQEQGLVATSEIGALMFARVTERGQDVALGCATVPGVKRPVPRELEAD
jgi:molybdopterin/thiamine biosynthesis adenylyltransferase